MIGSTFSGSASCSSWGFHPWLSVCSIAGRLPPSWAGLWVGGPSSRARSPPDVYTSLVKRRDPCHVPWSELSAAVEIDGKVNYSLQMFCTLCTVTRTLCWFWFSGHFMRDSNFANSLPATSCTCASSAYSSTLSKIWVRAVTSCPMTTSCTINRFTLDVFPVCLTITK